MINPNAPRLRFLYICFLCFGVLLVGRAFHIQWLGDERLARLASSQFEGHLRLRSERGQILDAQGQALTANIEVKSLAANPQQLKRFAPLLTEVQQVLGLRDRNFKKRIETSQSGFLWIKRHLSKKEWKKLEERGIVGSERARSAGLWLVSEKKRFYPFGRLASPLLGTVDIDSQGQEGLELKFDPLMRGSEEKVGVLRDGKGRALLRVVGVHEPKDGSSLQLSIDSTLQFGVERLLSESLAKTGSQAGTVIVMDADTGGILSLAQRPNYDPNDRLAPAGLRRLRAITDGYEPGSTFKPIVYAVALKNGLKANAKFHGEFGQWKIQGRVIGEAEAHERFEWMTLPEMIQRSSNIVAGKLALKIGANPLVSGLKTLGFGRKTEIEFPGEIGGWMTRSPDKLLPIELATMGFGHGIVVTPIQIVRAYAAFLNGGFLVKPTLLLGQNPSQKQRFFSKNLADKVIHALKKASGPEGTGWKANVPGIEIAGKTGTAQTLDPKTKRYSTSRYISSFVGFALHQNPRLVVMTILDAPKGIYYASETAAPLFREVMSLIANHYAFPKEKVLEQYLAEAKKKAERLAESESLVISRSGSTPEDGKTFDPGPLPFVSMPEVRGLSSRDAMIKIQKVSEAVPGLQMKLHGFGRVMDQFPEPGSRLMPQQEIKIVLSTRN